MILKGLIVSVGLCIGTFIYGFIVHPQMLVAVVIERCWFEFVGVMSLALIEDLARIMR
jgi:hypothetical protein